MTMYTSTEPIPSDNPKTDREKIQLIERRLKGIRTEIKYMSEQLGTNYMRLRDLATEIFLLLAKIEDNINKVNMDV